MEKRRSAERAASCNGMELKGNALEWKRVDGQCTGKDRNRAVLALRGVALRRK
nr:MAG TPA: hypothetical protein [Caudoviricetes sp.]